MPTLWIRWRIEDTRPSATDPADAPNAARGSIEGQQWDTPEHVQDKIHDKPIS